jgi:hypothetical protein
MLDQVHQQFIDVVKQGRGNRLKDDPTLFTGLFWTGAKAVDLGLADAIGSSTDVQRGTTRDAWAQQGRAIFQDYPATDNLVYDLSYEVNRSLWDAFFLSGADQARAEAFLKDPSKNPLPNGRLRLNSTSGKETKEEDLRDLHLAASRLVVDGAFNVNSLSVEAWKAVLSGARAASPDGKVRFPRVLSAPGNTWTSGDSPTDGSAWNGERVLTDGEIDRLARAIVVEVRKRAPFLSLADFVNRRLADDANGRMGPLQAAIDAGLRNPPGVVITELPEEVPAPIVAAARARGAAKDAPEC